jgi:hypothetical protein
MCPFANLDANLDPNLDPNFGQMFMNKNVLNIHRNLKMFLQLLSFSFFFFLFSFEIPSNKYDH